MSQSNVIWLFKSRKDKHSYRKLSIIIDLLSFVSIIGSAMLGPTEKVLKIMAFIWLENAILRLVFANRVNTSFDCTFFQLLHKQYVAVNPSKIT